jgi:diacylglycerol kinase family enzyme
LRNLPTLFDGTHIRHPLASRAAVRRVDFELDGPVNVMVDGECRELDCRTIEVLPDALDIFA